MFVILFFLFIIFSYVLFRRRTNFLFFVLLGGRAIDSRPQHVKHVADNFVLVFPANGFGRMGEKIIKRVYLL